jgi:4-hydroxy-tetrahydrodipicolinate synthase
MSALFPTGIFCAALTPVTEDLSPDLPALVEHCRWLLEQGCDGVALLGSTGEANSFSVAERMRILEGLVEAGVPAERLLPGTGCAALTDTVELTRHAVSLDVAGVVMLPPFYYKDVTVDGLLASYETVIDRVGDDRLKIVLYHIPPIAQVPIPLALIERLRKRYAATVVGIKDSGGDLSHMIELVRRFPGLAVLAGADPLLLPLLRQGGAGCITATSNIAARELATIYAGWRDPAGESAVEVAQARVTELRARVSRWPQIAALKAATASRTGRPGWTRVRPPLVALDAAQREALQTALAAPLPEAELEQGAPS